VMKPVDYIGVDIELVLPLFYRLLPPGERCRIKSIDVNGTITTITYYCEDRIGVAVFGDLELLDRQEWEVDLDGGVQA